MQESVDYSVKIGSLDFANKRGKRQFSALTYAGSLNSEGAWCHITLPGEEEISPALDDAVSIKLYHEGMEVSIFTGVITQVTASPAKMLVEASDSIRKLAEYEFFANYEGVSAGFIIKDIITAAGIKAGAIDQGPTFSQYTLHPGIRAIRHISDLARLTGTCFFIDSNGSFQLQKPQRGSSQHTFTLGKDIVSVDLQKNTLAFDSIAVYGEGAASRKGAEKAHWLAESLATVTGKASIDKDNKVQKGKQGKRTKSFCAGCIRSGDMASNMAEAQTSALSLRLYTGDITVFGYPPVRPGDLVDIDATNEARKRIKSPLPQQGTLLQVRRVIQRINSSEGFTTRMEF